MFDIFSIKKNKINKLEKDVGDLTNTIELLVTRFIEVEDALTVILKDIKETQINHKNAIEGTIAAKVDVQGMINSMNTLHDNVMTVVKALNEKGILTEEDLD
jgi:hypothetical protein